MSAEGSTTQTMTFISRRAPYGEDYPRACLDMVMAAAVFDQSVRYIFMDDGVWQLTTGQQPDQIRAKDLSAHFGALSLYGVEAIYAERASLEERGLDESSLNLPVQVLETDELRTLIHESDRVFVL